MSMVVVGSKSRYAVAILLIISILMVSYTACNNNQTPSYEQQLYTAYCANCHMENGEGLAALIPPLAQSDYLMQHIEELPCLIKYGMKGEITVNGKQYNQIMPANEKLTADKIQAIINFTLNKWGNKHRTIYVQEVEQQLKKCVIDSSLFSIKSDTTINH